ncbi:YceI family protein [Candidatus Uhrbacteria bacterium]|nr:YceI family protein [Candidatus Uhrbacteria bacterium]
MRVLYVFIVAIIVAGGIYWYVQNKQQPQRLSSEAQRGSFEAQSQDGEPPSAPFALQDGTYTVVAEESSIGWEGRKPLLANYKDTGSLKLKNGSAEVKDGKVASGTLVFDMTTIQAGKTGKGIGEEALTGHLKSEAFFDAGKYPTAMFVLQQAVDQGANTYLLRGELTIKGITNPVEIPAALSIQGDAIALRADMHLDRTLWDIRYGSGKFFDNLADNVIDDTFGATFALTFKKS